MSYGQTAGSNGPTTSLSLMSDSETHLDRLNDIHSRLVKIGDTLHGSQPREVAASPKQELQQCLRTRLDQTSTKLIDLEIELSRIEARL